jgi:hypothetical protein
VVVLAGQATYDAVEAVVTEVATLFPDTHMHLGGGGAGGCCPCWEAAPHILDFMVKRDILSYPDLLQVRGAAVCLCTWGKQGLDLCVCWGWGGGVAQPKQRSVTEEVRPNVGHSLSPRSPSPLAPQSSFLTTPHSPVLLPQGR